MLFELLLLFLILFIGIFGSVNFRKLTLSGALMGGVIAIAVYLGAGFTGISILGAFFVLAILATKWQNGYKQTLGLEEKNRGRRNAYQVLANGGVAGLLGIISIIFPSDNPVFPLLIAASLSAATADTLSSELGIIYGQRHINIWTLKKDQCGLDGVISLEGTLFGILGSLVIAIIYVISYGWTIHFFWIIIGGLVGNLSDSLLGVLFERKGYLKNNAVNFLNTAIGAFTAGLLNSLS